MAIGSKTTRIPGGIRVEFDLQPKQPHAAAPIAYTKDRPTSPGLYLCWHEGDNTPMAYDVAHRDGYGLCVRLQYIGGPMLTPITRNRFDDTYWHKLPDNLGWNPHDDDN